MELPLFYTPRAKETLNTTYSLVKNRYGIAEAEKFLEKAEKVIELIKIQPEMFKAADIGDNIRIAYITRQTSLFYRVSTVRIDLLFFWDNRQQPIL